MWDKVHVGEKAYWKGPSSRRNKPLPLSLWSLYKFLEDSVRDLIRLVLPILDLTFKSVLSEHSQANAPDLISSSSRNCLLDEYLYYPPVPHCFFLIWPSLDDWCWIASSCRLMSSWMLSNSISGRNTSSCVMWQPLSTRFCLLCRMQGALFSLGLIGPTLLNCCTWILSASQSIDPNLKNFLLIRTSCIEFSLLLYEIRDS